MEGKDPGGPIGPCGGLDRVDSSLDLGLGDLFRIEPKELLGNGVTNSLEEGLVFSRALDLMPDPLEKGKLEDVDDGLDASDSFVRQVLGLQDGLFSPKKKNKASLLKRGFF